MSLWDNRDRCHLSLISDSHLPTLVISALLLLLPENRANMSKFMSMWYMCYIVLSIFQVAKTSRKHTRVSSRPHKLFRCILHIYDIWILNDINVSLRYQTYRMFCVRILYQKLNCYIITIQLPPQSPSHSTGHSHVIIILWLWYGVLLDPSWYIEKL